MTRITNQQPPLVVDLDGTLIRTDLLLESGLSYLQSKPWDFLKPLVWLISGKAYLKDRLANSTPLDVANLPYDSEVLQLIHEEKSKGRKLVLATASHQIYADRIAAHLSIFDQVFATSNNTNLSSKAKSNLLVQEYGEKGFDYIGNSKDDLPVWQKADRAYVVNSSSSVKKRALALGNVEKVIEKSDSQLKAWIKAFRFYQWIKNILIFVPLLASHQFGNSGMLVHALIAFFCFGLCASSTYILNDLLDLSNDRMHRTKKNRPFACGRLPVLSGLIMFPILLLTAFTISSWLLPSAFTFILGLYSIMTLSYSIRLKRMMFVDVITLALLYTIRIIAGAFAVGLTLTFWMLAFSMFIFLSLALVKRYAELLEGRHKGEKEKARGRGYYPDDLEMIASLGASSGYLSVLVFALYMHEETTRRLYQNPTVLWLACPLLLFWISRTWMVTHRGEMHDDPIVYAMKDRISLMVVALFGLIFWFSL